MKVIQELVGYFERRGKLTPPQIDHLLQQGFLASDAPDHLVDLCQNVGQVHYFRVTGKVGGTVWGTDVYTGDSSLGTAVVHAGLVKLGETRVVRVTVLEPLATYRGSTQNGVTSHDYGSYPTAYRVDAV